MADDCTAAQVILDWSRLPQGSRKAQTLDIILGSVIISSDEAVNAQCISPLGVPDMMFAHFAQKGNLRYSSGLDYCSVLALGEDII